jgi:tRNA(Ile)-lysidine synthase
MGNLRMPHNEGQGVLHPGLRSPPENALLTFLAAHGPLTDARRQSPPHFCVGLSGGLDSTLLLHLLHALAPHRGFYVSALHIHHGLSPQADEWADFCQKEADRLGVLLTVVRVTVDRQAPEGLEAAARNARHAVFKAYPADAVFLAHHLNDQAETLLFRLLRGASPHGLSAMKPRQGRLCRPWLGLARTHLEAEARRRGLVWVEDESNADTRFRRNFIRHRLLPVMEEGFPGALSVLGRCADLQAEAASLLDERACEDSRALAEPSSSPVAGMPLLRRADFGQLSPARQTNLLAWLFRQSGQDAPRHAVLHAHRQALRSGSKGICSGTEHSTLVAWKDRWALIPEPRPPVPSPQICQGEGTYPWAFGSVTLQTDEAEGGHLPRALLFPPPDGPTLTLRTRWPGLRFRLTKNGVRRDFKHLAQYRDWPDWARDWIPVLEHNGQALWMGGAGVNADYATMPGEPGLRIDWAIPPHWGAFITKNPG